MKHVVVGTAGHVDHGKTSLVEALTGTNCDRLPEEKARGITIELGFARWDLPGGLRASVVDVPGHERFVRTMVTGASGIDVVVLCVAADDGVMPQTREHLAVCGLLGLRAGVVAITKVDLVDAETLALVEDDVRDAIRASFLEGAQVVHCSARERRGLDELGAAVAGAVRECPVRSQSGPAFLSIDRVFTKSGAGVVATGTLVRGAIAVGDELDVVPSARGDAVPVKVRGLQVHGEAAERVVSPSRVAVNVRGDVEGMIARGGALATTGWQRPTRLLLADIELLPSAKQFPRQTTLALHVGTAHRSATLTLASAEAIAPGGRGVGRIALTGPIAAFTGQRFVLRREEAGRERTVGGGIVIDPHPRTTRGRGVHAHVGAPDAHARVRALVDDARYAGIDGAELGRRALPDDDVPRALAALAREKSAVEVGGRWYSAALLDEAKQQALACVRALHEERPLKTGFAPGEVVTRAPARLRPLVAAAVDVLALDRVLAHDGGLVRDAARARVGGDLLDAISRVYAAAGLTPPLDEEARATVHADPRAFRDAMAELKRAGRIRMLSGGLHFDLGALAALKLRVVDALAQSPSMAPADFKAICGGVSRKFAIALLEWLDSEGVTRRQGDARVAGPAAKRA